MIRIERLDWATGAAELLAIRFEVFVQEQKVPEELEADERDPQCVHVAARWQEGSGQASGWIGTARLTPEGRIGRMAVLAPWRGRGVGGALLAALVEIAAQQRLRQVVLLGQLQALPFYEKHGFEAHGPVIEEAGIDHRSMTRVLGADSSGGDTG